jgi:hypothetical protein
MKRKLLHIAALFLCLGLNAQPDSIKRPIVGDHTFTPVTQSNLPFTNSYFYMMTGIGKTTDLVHQLELIDGSRPIGLQGEVSFIDVGFTYQQRVRDWLAVYISFDLSARLGTELQSMLTQGANTMTGFNLGWHFKILDRDKVALSTIAEIQNLEGSFINIMGYVQDVINDHPYPSLSQKIPVLVFSTGLRFAWGLSDLVGLKASLDFAYGESYNRGENGFNMSASAGIDLDFYKRYSLPLGFAFSATITSMSDIVYVQDSYAKLMRAKIAYTKSPDFNLGIEVSYMKIPLFNQDKPPSAVSFALTSRFYF